MPEGLYHIYGRANDGVNAEVIEYASGTLQIPYYAPSISIVEPADDTKVDTFYWIRWDANVPNGVASINLFLDPDNNYRNNNHIPLISGISSADGLSAARVDLSSVTPGVYYVGASINQSATPEDASTGYSSRRLTIAHDGAPQIQFAQPARSEIILATGGNFVVPIQFTARASQSDATVELYYDLDARNYDGTAIVASTQALPLTSGMTSTYLWDTSALPSRDYYIYGIVHAGTETGQTYAPGVVRVNQPPTIELTAPLGTEASAEASFTITWIDADDGDNAWISLYYDTDNTGADGVLIVSDLREDPDGSGDRYVWDLTRVPAGKYYVYAVIDDRVNDPVIAYSPGQVEVTPHIPRATVLTPNNTYGDVVVDHTYTVVYTAYDIDSDASIDFYLDTNTNLGGEIPLATGEVYLSNSTGYQTLDLSKIPEGEYFIQIRMSDDDRATEYAYYSQRRIFVRHAGSPAVVVDDSSFAGVATETEVEIRYQGESINPDARINLYRHTSRTYSTSSTPIALGLSPTGPTPASLVVSVTDWSSQSYYVIATISDGLNPLVYNISNRPIVVNRAPTFEFITPVLAEVGPDNPTGDRDLYTIRWNATDPDDTIRIAFYYDTDHVGFDGTLIVDGQLKGTNRSYVWDASQVPGGTYYIYAVVNSPNHEPLKVYSPGTFLIDQDRKPRLTILSPYSGDDTWSDFFVIQWDAFDFDSDATIGFYVQNATPGFDGTERVIVEGISEDNDDDFYVWDISQEATGSLEIIGVIRDATWTIVATAPRPLKIQRPVVENEVPKLVFVDPGNSWLPDNIRVSNARVRGNITSDPNMYTLRFVAYDKEAPENTRISLYWDSNATGLDGTLIAKNLSLTSNAGVNSYDWDISNVPGGTYYFYATVFDGVNDPVSYYSRSVLHINREPKIEIFSPESPFNVVNDQLVIRWTATDPDSAATISLYYDTRGEGFDGTLIASGFNSQSGGGVKAAMKWLEDRYQANIRPNAPGVNNSQPWFRDSYYTYGFAKGLRLYEVLRFAGRDWDDDLLNFFATDSMKKPDGSFDMSFGSGGHLSGSGENFATMHTSMAILSMTEAVLGTKPVADAGQDVRVAPGQLVAFDASESYHPNRRRKIILYEWDFNNDGVFDFASEEPTAEYTFTQIGAYPVTLRVSDNDFCGALTDDDVVVVTVTDGNRPPVAAIKIDPMPGLVGYEVTFDGRLSTDPDGDAIVQYEWDLNGNGLFNDGEGPVVSYIYDRVQTVNIGLRVTDNDPQEPLSGFTRMNLDVVQADLTIIAQGDAPDPFSPGASPGRKDTSVISFDLSKAAHPKIQLWDVQGQLARILGPESRQRGGNTYSWDGRNDEGELAPSNLYTYKIGDQGALLYSELGWHREDGVRLANAGDPKIRRREDFTLQMLYTSGTDGNQEIRGASSDDGLEWTDEGVLIPRGLAGAFDSAGGSHPEFVQLKSTTQDSWSAGIGIDYASGSSVVPTAGGLQLAGFSRNIALGGTVVSASCTAPENYFGTGSLNSLIDGVLPTPEDARHSGWVNYYNRSATMAVDLSEVRFIEKVRVYLKTDNQESTKVFYPRSLRVLTGNSLESTLTLQQEFDLRGMPQEDTASWVEVSFPGGLGTRYVFVEADSYATSWMSIGEIEVLQEGFDSAGFLISNVFDLGEDGLLSVKWEGTRPGNTSLTVQVRSGNTPEPDASWSAFTSMGQNEIVLSGMHARYVQYRADLRTGLEGNTKVTPILRRVRFNDLRRIYYTGNDGTQDRILSAISLDGVSYVTESGVRIEPAGPYAQDGVACPVYIPTVDTLVLADFSTLQSSAQAVQVDGQGALRLLSLATVGPNIAAASEGTTVLADFDRYGLDYRAELGIEGDGGANRGSRWAGRDKTAPAFWTIDFDLGQERTLAGVRMLRHDASYETTGFKLFGGMIYSSSDANNFESFTQFYNSPTYTSGTDHFGAFSPVTARYVRLHIDRWSNSHPEFAEFELYGAVQYATEGVFLSSVFLVGEQGLTSLQWDADVPGGTSIQVEARTGPVFMVDDRWSDFVVVQPQISLTETGLAGQFAQLRITFTGDGIQTPELRSVSLNGNRRLYYTGTSGGISRILSAVSNDGVTWVPDPVPMVDIGGIAGFESVKSPDVQMLPDKTFVLYFLGRKAGQWAIYQGVSENGLIWDLNEEPVISLVSGETGFGGLQFLPLLDGTSRLYFTSLSNTGRRILSAASAPEGQVEIDNFPPDVAIAFRNRIPH